MVNKTNPNHLVVRDRHLSEETLLMLVDGELETRDAAVAKEHLETCWSCRANLESIEETISAFVDFKRNLQTPTHQPPPSGWVDFRSLLSEAGRQEPPESRSRTGFGALRFLRLRWVASVVIVSISLAILWGALKENEVSAMELMERAVNFEQRRMSETDNPVVFKRLAMRTGDRSAVDLGVWSETSSTRSRQEILPTVTEENREVLREITKLMERSGVGIDQLMSPKSIRDWHSSKKDIVSKVVTDEFYTLETRAIGAIPDGGIAALSVRYRRDDFHPVMQILKIRTVSGDRTIEIEERTFDVVERRSLPEDFFNLPELALDVPDKESVIAESVDPDVDDQIIETPMVSATADLEVYALTLLSSVAADLGEEISVSRSAGILAIRGVVDNQARLAEIEAALQPLSSNPAVKLELETIAQAMTRQRDASASSNLEIREIETSSAVSAAERDLIDFFGAEAEARRFAQVSVARSNSGMTHIYALRRLVSQFRKAELQSMSPDARSAWFALIKRHAIGFRTQNGVLSAELSTVLRVQREGTPVIPSPTDISSLLETLNRLISTATTNDQLVRSALTISNEQSRFSAIKARAFWQSIETADALASAVADFR